MISLDRIRALPRRLIFFYVAMGLSVLAMIGVAIWLMPHIPNLWGLRDFTGWGLFIVLAGVWTVLAKLFLSDEEARELLPKRKDD